MQDNYFNIPFILPDIRKKYLTRITLFLSLGTLNFKRLYIYISVQQMKGKGLLYALNCILMVKNDY